MTRHEGFPTGQEAPLASYAAVFHEDGTLNEEFLSENFGLGAQEAMQPVAFGNYTGTVAQMLADEKCPVGAMVGQAYQEQGIAGVTEKFKTLGQMDSRFSVEITQATLAREDLKKK
jgi:hypothetical protein